MPLQGLQHGGLHLFDALPEELFRSRLQQLVGLHDLALGHAGNRQGNAMGCLNALAHGVQGHHLERQSLNVRDKPPCPRPSSHYRVLLRGSTTSTCNKWVKVRVHRLPQESQKYLKNYRHSPADAIFRHEIANVRDFFLKKKR